MRVYPNARQQAMREIALWIVKAILVIAGAVFVGYIVAGQF
jgi:hypothetical protein